MYRTICVMAYVSKKKLPAVMKKTVTAQLLRIAGEGRAGRQALADLFTETEQIMLAKRLAAIVLFLEGASAYRVWHSLSLSPSTAARLRRNLDAGLYRAIEKVFRARKEREEFWHSLEKLSRGGLPEMGKGRWQWLAELEKQEH